jgi:hypothetical protein
VLSQPSSARVLLERRHGEMVWSPAVTCPHHLPTGQTSPDLVSCLAEIPSSYLASFPIWIFLLYFRFYFWPAFRSGFFNLICFTPFLSGLDLLFPFDGFVLI